MVDWPTALLRSAGLSAASPAPDRGQRAADPPGVGGPQSAATPAKVQALLAEVTRIRPQLTAFFGCLYYAALRPAEAVALCASSCTLPSRGWGQLTLTGSLPGRRVPRPVTARHANHAASNTARKASSGRSRSPRSLPHPPLAPAELRVCRRWATVPECPWRSAQRKPLRPDLAPGPGRSHAGGQDRRPAGALSLRSASCRAVSVAGLPAPRLPRSLPAPGTACGSCSPSTPSACPAATKSPVSTSSKPSAPAAGPRLATTIGQRHDVTIRLQFIYRYLTKGLCECPRWKLAAFQRCRSELEVLVSWRLGRHR